MKNQNAEIDLKISLLNLFQISPLWEELRDEEGRLLYISPECERITGHPPDKFLNTPDLLEKLIHPDDRMWWKNHTQRLLSENAPCQMAFRIILPGGEHRWIERKCHPIHLESGETLQRFIHTDITAQKQLESSFLDLEVNVKALELFPEVSIVIYDLEGRITFANQFFASLFGKRAEELIHCSIWDLFPPQPAEFRKTVFDQVISTGEMMRVEDYGQTGIYESNVFPLRKDGGEIIRIAVISRNITAYKEAQKALEEAHKKLEKRVQERTRELNEANRLLQEQIRQKEAVEKQLRNQIKQSQAMAQVAEKLNSTLVLEEVLQTVCEEMYHGIPDLPVTSVLLYDETKDAYVIAAANTIPPHDLLINTTPVPRPVYESFVRGSDDILIIEDASQVEGLHDEELARAIQLKTIVSIPIIHKNEIIGALNSSSIKQPYQPSEQEVNFLKTLAYQAGIAITNALLFKEISTQYERVKSLSQSLLEVQEKERASLSQELHDEIGQALTSINLKLKMVINQVNQQRHKDTTAIKQLKEVHGITTQLLDEVRELSLNLRPTLLEDLGVVPALLNLFERFKNQLHLEVDFKHNGVTDKRYPPTIELNIYRIVQEALTNVARHANVNQAMVRLWAEDQRLNCQIEDRGSGFNPYQKLRDRMSIGLAGIQERVNQCQGRLDIESQSGKGTCITVEIPLPPENQEEKASAD